MYLIIFALFFFFLSLNVNDATELVISDKRFEIQRLGAEGHKKKRLESWEKKLKKWIQEHKKETSRWLIKWMNIERR